MSLGLQIKWLAMVQLSVGTNSLLWNQTDKADRLKEASFSNTDNHPTCI